MFQTNSEITTSFAPVSAALRNRKFFGRESGAIESVVVSDSRYTVKIARTSDELTELLRLRYQVFKVELGNENGNSFGLEQDEFDASSHHLIAVENSSNRIVGGYRLRTVELVSGKTGFYSAGEFRLADVPEEVASRSVEIGRACITPSHRNGKVLFLLWKGLAKYVLQTGKRYLFGCCSLFSQNRNDGIEAFNQLRREGFLHETIRLRPLESNSFEPQACAQKISGSTVEIPKLFKSYLQLGAKVCSPPVVDSEFGTIDFFVILDMLRINPKYRKMFF